MIVAINPKREEWEALLKRPTMELETIEAIVKPVMEAVKADGDQALIDFTKKFDGVEITNFEVSSTEIDAAMGLVPEELKAAIHIAKQNIETFHAAQKGEVLKVETMPGVNCYRKSVAIEKVGLYIPGGTAPLFSTVLMLAIPAKIAGCKEIVLCTPPDKNGNVNPAILFTAQLVGVTKIYKVGGAQAIAALTFGTTTIPKVNKIWPWKSVCHCC